jgi:hypothetical protein
VNALTRRGIASQMEESAWIAINIVMLRRKFGQSAAEDGPRFTAFCREQYLIEVEFAQDIGRRMGGSLI